VVPKLLVYQEVVLTANSIHLMQLAVAVLADSAQTEQAVALVVVLVDMTRAVLEVQELRAKATMAAMLHLAMVAVEGVHLPLVQTVLALPAVLVVMELRLQLLEPL